MAHPGVRYRAGTGMVQYGQGKGQPVRGSPYRAGMGKPVAARCPYLLVRALTMPVHAPYGHVYGGAASEAFAWGQCLHKRKHHVCLRMHHHISSGCGSQRTWEKSAENRKCVFFMSVALPCFCCSAVWNKSVLVHKLYFISMQKQLISTNLPVDGMCCAFCFCLFVCVFSG